MDEQVVLRDWWTIEIEGMPCLTVSTDLGDHRYGGVGVTCDWTQWEGNQ